ncbi:MAG TPA: nicotinate phosphoribosyltransferase [Tepidisphaeraceae bacterium]|nr:nicotinate phosphoribosyltransferase [Tepidisphaeraceae bacterium]
MSITNELYRHSLALLTDLYELTMAYGYWKLGMADRESAFYMQFRQHPFGGGFTVACGLEYLIDYLKDFRFTEGDVAYLATLTGADGKPLFEKGFLDYLRDLRLTCDIDAVPEGTVVFPQEPLVRVVGPVLQAQIIEAAVLNLVNFQTLIATRAARVCMAARGEPVLEFGLRRAQGIDGGIAASRAAYVGGCAATSNVLAGKLFDIPVRGTHAHSWVMCFDSELESFEGYARVMPNNCIFLVDTYDTLEGVRHAVEAGRWLRENGHKLLGIRLDSGDLAYLSIEARKILDEAGFTETRILASSELDENIITSLKDQGATITMWGVGTRLATAYDQPALGGVYKISALRNKGGVWNYKIKLSEQTAKISTPGILQVRRYREAGEFVGDAIFDEVMGIAEPCTIVDPLDMTRRKTLGEGMTHEDLLVPIFRKGRLTYQSPRIEQSRRRVQEQLAGFHSGIKRFVHPHQYPAGLERRLHDLKTKLILRSRGVANNNHPGAGAQGE